MKPLEFFKVDKFTNYFVVTKYNPLSENIIKNFCKQYIQYGLVKVGYKWQRVPFKVFAAHCQVMREYRFHKNQWNEFVRHCSAHGASITKIPIVEHAAKRGVFCDLKDESGKELRDYQIPIMSYLDSEKPPNIKLVGIQTGKGKTVIATKAICISGRRFAAVLKAKYMDKWVSDVNELTDCTKHEILVIRGSTSLMAAIDAGISNTLEHKAIIISNRTLQNYITLYEEKGDKILDMGYGCCPQDLFETLGVDTRLIDEVHEDFHFNFKLDLYTHVHRCISLSATLLSEDSFLTRMYELAYPLEERFDEMEYDKYIHSHAYLYEIENAETINTVNNGMYSHHLVEQYILKNKSLCDEYFRMIVGLWEEYFKTNFKPGERALVYCASIDMCTALTQYLQEDYPNVDIRRYVENDPYENLMDSRTSISTIQSAGTGHDIKGLVFVLLTVAVASSKSNIQGFGRLRKIDSKDLHFVYLVCANMPKHMQYHEQKKQLLLTRSLKHDDILSNKVIGKRYDNRFGYR